jgi:hypothetical protein
MSIYDTIYMLKELLDLYMKTQISKLFFVFAVTIISLGLFSPSNASAQQTQFNTLSNDRPTIQVSNHTNNPGCTSCWSTSVSADPGDIVSVYIYYHNTGTVAANNTKVKLNVNQGADSQYHNISGFVSASNANASNGSASINLSQSESLVFDNYVKWYPNHQITNPATLLSGQNGSEVLGGSGLSIGNISPDAPLGSFSTQGSVVVRFRVTNTQTPPPQVNCSIDSFTASPSPINYGYFSTLNWNTTNCNNLTIVGPGVSLSNINPDGSTSTGALYNPSNTYTITGYGDNGMVQRTATVIVTGQPANNCVIDSFYADQSNLSYGQSTTLYWTTTNCNNVSIVGGNINQYNLSTNGSISTNSLYSNTTFTINATGQNGSDSDQETVTVSGQQQNNCIINSFTASPNSVNSGYFSTLNWNTTNCNYVRIVGGNINQNNLNADGSKSTGALYSDTTFTLTAYGNNGSVTSTVTVDVNGNNNDDCEIDSFYASPDEIEEGEDTTLYWQTTDCDDVYISNGIGNVNDDGSEDTDDLYEDETYTITATGNNSSDSKTITVRVDEDNNDDDCEIDDFYASPSSVSYGDDTKLYWETTDCDDVYISNGVGNVDDDGDERVDNIYSTTTFTITAHGDNGSDSDSVTVYVKQAPVYENTSVTTLGVQNVTKTTADLAGVLVYTGNQTTNVWFEYGTTPNLGNVTTQTAFYSSINTPFTKSISGLTPDTLYYFKAIANNQNGRTEGVVRNFRTSGATSTNTNTVVYVNSGTGESLLNLDITSAFENVGVGEQYDIDIAYENTSSTVTARDTTLNIVLPKNLVFQRISRGEYNLRDHTIFVDLEDVSPKEKGEITLQVVVGSKAQSGELLVTIGTLNYEKNSKKEEVIDILTNKVTEGSSLGAFALGTGFWPNTLIGWLILLVIFLMIIYIANRMFRRKNVAQPMTVPVPPQTYR